MKRSLWLEVCIYICACCFRVSGCHMLKIIHNTIQKVWHYISFFSLFAYYMPSDSCLNDYRGEQKTVALKSTRRSHGLPYLKVSMSFISGMSKGTHQIVTQLDYKFTILYTYAKYDIYIYICIYLHTFIFLFIHRYVPLTSCCLAAVPHLLRCWNIPRPRHL